MAEPVSYSRAAMALLARTDLSKQCAKVMILFSSEPDGCLSPYSPFNKPLGRMGHELYHRVPTPLPHVMPCGIRAERAVQIMVLISLRIWHDRIAHKSYRMSLAASVSNL